MEVETKRPDIGYELKEIVKEMLSCGSTYLDEDTSFTVSLKIDEDEEVVNVVSAKIVVSMQVPDSLLERIKSNL